MVISVSGVFHKRHQSSKVLADAFGISAWSFFQASSDIYESLTDTLSGGSYKGTIELP